MHDAYWSSERGHLCTADKVRLGEEGFNPQIKTRISNKRLVTERRLTSAVYTGKGLGSILIITSAPLAWHPKLTKRVAQRRMRLNGEQVKTRGEKQRRVDLALELLSPDISVDRAYPPSPPINFPPSNNGESSERPCGQWKAHNHFVTTADPHPKA